MIQRIQSVHLLIASLLIFGLFFFPIAHDVYIGTIPQTIKVDGIYQMLNGQLVRTTSFLALTIVTIIMGILPLVIIFMYKNRKLQMALCYGLVLVLFGFSFWLSQTVKEVMNGIDIKVENFGIGAVLTSFSIVFLLWAAKRIQADEKLVKSADRLR